MDVGRMAPVPVEEVEQREESEARSGKPRSGGSRKRRRIWGRLLLKIARSPFL